MTTLSEAARRAKNNYQSEYRKRNPEKLKQHMANYWERRAAKEAEAEEIRLAHWLNPTTCQECGKNLEGKREDAKFCSSACRQKHHRGAKL
jgi:hypothetical protein